MVDISLLPKEEIKKPEPAKKLPARAEGIFPAKFLWVGILLITLSALITLGLFLYNNALSSNLESLNRSIDSLKQEEAKYTPIEKEARLLQSQLNSLQNLISKHKYWSGIISALADYTPLEVQYKSIVCEEKEKRFTLTGLAKDYQSVARLMVSLRKALLDKKNLFEEIELESAKLGFDENKQIKVEFSVSFKLMEDALLVNPESSAQTSESPAAKNVVYVTDKWNPSELRIKQGEEVTWINQSTFVHQVVSFEGLFNSGDISPGASYKYKFEKSGTYKYYCPIHSPEKDYFGTIIVE